jgi:hypothetical protein
MLRAVRFWVQEAREMSLVWPGGEEAIGEETRGEGGGDG